MPIASAWRIKGSTIVIPKERVKEKRINSLDENVRTLMDQALDSLSRNDVKTARALVDQARGLNTTNSALIDNLIALNQKVTDSEVHGGSPEERRQQAELLLQRANEAYDMIRTEEGNEFLIKALTIDPTYKAAGKRIELLDPEGSTQSAFGRPLFLMKSFNPIT